MTAVAAIKVSDSALESDQVSRSIPTTKHCNNSAPRHKQPDEEESSEGGRVLTDVSSSGASSDADASNVAGDGKLDECCANDDDDDDGDRDNISDDQCFVDALADSSGEHAFVESHWNGQKTQRDWLGGGDQCRQAGEILPVANLAKAGRSRVERAASTEAALTASDNNGTQVIETSDFASKQQMITTTDNNLSQSRPTLCDSNAVQRAAVLGKTTVACNGTAQAYDCNVGRTTGDNRCTLGSDGALIGTDCSSSSSSSSSSLSSASSQPPPAPPSGSSMASDEADPFWTGVDAPLSERLEKTKVILRMALNNEFAAALDICSRRADTDLYASLANAVLSFLRVALTLEQNDLQAAVESINRSFELSSKLRKKTNMLSRFFLYRPNYNQDHTDEQIHAELVHAESLLLLALISFLADQSLMCLVRGAFRIRACYQHYKTCLYIMEQRKHWHSDEARRHFESGVRMGYGIFNLLMSYLPRRVLRLLEYVGFSGNRTVGVDELDKSIEADDGLRSVFSALVILTYHSYVENIFGLGDYDQVKVEKLLHERFEQNYPNSAFYFLFRGRYNQMLGKLDEALENFNKCIESQSDWKQFHSICHWEMMWCHAVQLDWVRAAHYSDLLRKNSKWSVASYTYQYATFLYAKLVGELNSGTLARDSDEFKTRMVEIREIMQQVPKLRIRYAGKTLPTEKFAIERALKFVEFANGNERLCLPALEFLYVWNIFVTLRNSPKQVEQILGHIDNEIERHLSSRTRTGESGADEDENEEEEEEEEEDHWADDLSVMKLLKGMCLKHLQRFEEAQRCFLDVVEGEESIRRDTFLVPHCAMELALLNLIERKFNDSKYWIKVVRNNYTGYLLETIVHFRLHAASRSIRLEQEGSSDECVAKVCGPKLEASFEGSEVGSKLSA